MPSNSSPTVALPSPAAPLPFASLAPLRALAAMLAGWFTAHRVAAADRQTLAGMSERELLDIGLPVNAMPNARDTWWPADYPR